MERRPGQSAAADASHDPTARAGRLAIFLPALLGGGAERTMLNLAHGIAARGHAVDLVLSRAEGPYLSQVEDPVRIVDLDRRGTLASLPSLVRYLRRERPAALLSALTRANVVALVARRITGLPLRVVVNEQNTMSSWIQKHRRHRAWLTALLVKRCYPWADAIVGVSRGVVDDLVEDWGMPRERTRVVHNPVVTPQLRSKVRAPLSHPWFAPGQPPTLLAVGSLTPQKDFATLLRAFALTRAERPVRLLILGEGHERPMLEGLVRELDLEPDVGLPGYVDNPYPYMAHCAAFVLSSRWEGLPTVLAEALYCGTALVATDCPSGPREILRGGAYGRLVPVGDPGALARAIGDALAEGKRETPAESWQAYELETICDQYIRLLLPPGEARSAADRAASGG